MEAKFKVGDTVRIKHRVGKSEDYRCDFTDEMTKLEGQEFVIESSFLDDFPDRNKYESDGYIYKLKNDKKQYGWTSGMLELVNTKEMEKGIVKLSLKDAKKLYKQGGSFRTIALSAYSEDELAYIPKDGDFIYVKLNCGSSYIYIKDARSSLTSKYISLNLSRKEVSQDCYQCCLNSDIQYLRPATYDEKQILLKMMHEIGKDWDADNKKIVDWVWKPKKGEHYFAVVFSSLSDFYSLEIVYDEDEVEKVIEKRIEKKLAFKTEKEAEAKAKELNEKCGFK